jgi:hypothetical protein
MSNYNFTYNTPVSAGPGNQTWNIDPWLKSCRVRVYGGGGGGEYINNNLSSSAGTNGGSSSVFGVIANGGYGGGRRTNNTTAKGVGGSGGGTTLTNSPNFGVSITQYSGTGGSLPTGGSGRNGYGNGGGGSSGARTYYSSATHVFNNTTDVHNFSLSGSTSDISISYANPTAEGVNGTTPASGKHYRLTFTDAYSDNSWTYNISTSGTMAGAGGTNGAPYSLNGVANKSANGISIWFQTSGGGNTYIRDFAISTYGIKQAAIGRGGGGGGYAEFELTRQNLIDAGYDMDPYNANGTQQSGDLLSFVVGDGGGSPGASGGGSGIVQIAWFEIPQVYLSSNRTEMVVGQNATLTWTTQGDANAISFTSGGVNNSNLNSNSVVYPTISTTYTATATGLGGTSYNTESSVTIFVYQFPTIDKFEIPQEINFGEGTIQVEYGASYCDTSLKFVVRYSFDIGPQAGDGIIEGETIDIVVDNVSPFYEDTSTNSISGILDINLPWTEWGPSLFTITMEATGSGGNVNSFDDIVVNIDQQPDNIDLIGRGNTPDRLIIDAIATSPGVVIVDQGFELTGVDVPVEVKSDYPIQVTVNEIDDWKNVREI